MLGRREARHATWALATALAIVCAIPALGAGTSGGPAGTGVSPTPPRPARTPPAGDPAYSAAVDATLAGGQFLVRGGKQKRDVALTFDDGPSPYSLKIAAVLRRFGAGGTFFEIGQEVAHFPRVARALLSTGFVIGDHTLTHPVLAHHFIAYQRWELGTTAYSLWGHGVPFPRLFRPPYGSFDDATYTVLGELRMLMVLWSADSMDWATPGVKAIVRHALAGVGPGSIILMHDGGGNRSQTAAALPIIIRRLKAMGYRLVTVPQMLAENPPKLPQKVPDGMGPAATSSG